MRASVADETLKVLANETNQAILGLLAVEPTYPRKIGDLLSLPEAEVARRLKHMEGLGLVQSKWSYIGKNVKLYQLTVEGVTLQFTPEGLRLHVAQMGKRTSPSLLLTPFVMTVPHPGEFVGRVKELETLAGAEPVVIVEGMVGIGKTSLLAAYAHAASAKRPVFWHAFSGVESLNWLANRFALFYAEHGDRALLEAVERGAEAADKRRLILEGMDNLRFLIVFDDVHRLEDEAVKALLTDAIQNIQKAKLVLGTRAPVKSGRAAARVKILRLGGLSDEEVRRFLDLKKANVPPHLLPKVRDEVGGHPLALNLLLAAAREAGVSVEKLLDRIPEKNLEEYLLGEVYEGLGEEERALLTVASVFRGTFTFEDLQAVASRLHERTLVAVRRRLLLQSFDGRYGLHEIIRNFFYQHLADKSHIHAKAAAHYLGRGTVEGRLEAMHHFLAAQRRDRVLELLEQNLDLREFDFIDAGYQNLYLSTLELFDRGEVKDGRKWALMEDEKGDIWFHRGDTAKALKYYDSALAFFEKHPDAARLADLAWKRSMSLSRLGKQKQALEVCEKALKQLAADGVPRTRLEELFETLKNPAPPKTARVSAA